MNNNDLYIKMVLALPDSFFDVWEYKNGDHYIIQHPNGQLSDDYIVDVDCWDFDSDLNIRPLPNQRQLQSMLNLTPIEYIEDFYEYSQEPITSDTDPEQFKTDMECFMLAHVMDRKYKMIWNGEKWL